MCEFCVQHGEGRIWYLEAANHSRELMARLGTEARLRRHARTFERSTIRLFGLYDRFTWVWRRVPFLKRLAHAWATARQKRRHFGQVLPPEHVHQVLELAGSIVRLPCTCRRFVKGRAEARYCLGLGFDPWRVYGGLPGYDRDFEVLTPRQAIELTESFQREEGLVQTVWTFPTPFVASVCSCSPESCGAMLSHYRMGIGVLFPGELKATVSTDLCSGCRRCLAACPFGAICWDRETRRATADPSLCQGCGVCRWKCATGAINLIGGNGGGKAGMGVSGEAIGSV